MQSESQILNLIKNNNGYITTKKLKENRIFYKKIIDLINEDKIEKIKNGLYKTVNTNIYSSFIDISFAIPKGIVCLISALNYYELTTQNPPEIDVAIPNNLKKKNLIYPPVKYHYFRGDSYNLGIENIILKNYTFKIYDKEKTICDCLKNAKYIGEDIIIESIKSYVKLKDKDYKKLLFYADKLRVKNKIINILKILEG